MGRVGLFFFFFFFFLCEDAHGLIGTWNLWFVSCDDPGELLCGCCACLIVATEDKLGWNDSWL